MKTGFYAKLAVTGMRKNKRLYFPYLLTCACMVMMFYIVAYLATSPVLAAMKGGDSVQSMLGMGTMVILVFSVLFLFYTNSFLMRRRKREFGLYNILGMDKRNLARILAWESLFVALVSLVSGLALGVGLSKLSELLLVNLLGEKATLAFTVSAAGLWQSILLSAPRGRSILCAPKARAKSRRAPTGRWGCSARRCSPPRISSPSKSITPFRP